MSTGTPLIRSVAEFVERRTELALDEAEVARLQLLVLDGVGCLLGGSIEGAVQSIFEPTAPAGPDSGLFTTVDQTDNLWSAMFHDGVALRYLDFLDVYSSTDTCHPSENIPPAWRLAEHLGVSGRTFLEALAMGYEVQTRLADAIDMRQGGFHHVTGAALCVPVLAARLGVVNSAELVQALALAVAQGMTLRSVSQGALSMAKAFAFPLAARRALDSVALASRGVTGPSTALDDLVALADGNKAQFRQIFEADPDSSPHLSEIQLKSYPVQFALQAVVECGSALHDSFVARRDHLVGVHVVAGPKVVENTVDEAKRHPTTREAADHSLYSCLAMAVVQGQLRVEDFRHQTWLLPDANKIAQLITWEPEGPMSQPGQRRTNLGARVELRFADGTTEVVERDVPLGHPSRPLTADQVVAKFTGQAEQVVGADRCQQIVDLVMTLDQRHSMVGASAVLRL